MANTSGQYGKLGEAVMLPFSGRLSKNRFWKSGMTERLCGYSETEERARGHPSEAYVRLYDVFSRGELGVIVTGNIMVHRAYLEAKGNAVIDEQLVQNDVTSFASVARVAKANGSLVLGQLCHPGYQASPVALSERVCISPVDLEQNDGGANRPAATPLTVDDIGTIVQSFAHAASVLQAAGFDGVQLHAAYGHLLTQFLSPSTNRRADKYGGVFENRLRILQDIFTAIRQVVREDFIVSVKLNSNDFIGTGWTEHDGQLIAELAQQNKLDVLELSGGAYEFPSAVKQTEANRQKHEFFETFVSQITRHLKSTKIVINGGLRSAAGMQRALQNQRGDFVGLARVLCAEAHLAGAILSGTQVCAKDNKIPSAGLQFLGAVSQLRALGDGEEPADFSDPDVAAHFSSTAKWT